MQCSERYISIIFAILRGYKRQPPNPKTFLNSQTFIHPNQFYYYLKFFSPPQVFKMKFHIISLLAFIGLMAPAFAAPGAIAVEIRQANLITTISNAVAQLQTSVGQDLGAIGMLLQCSS